MIILVTGGSGFLGKYFVEEAIRRGHHIMWLGAEWTDPAYLPNAFSAADSVVHLAAAGTLRKKRNWTECLDVNFHALRRFLFALSASGATPVVMLAQSIREKDCDLDPLAWDDPYYVSKRMGSQFSRAWGTRYRGNCIHLVLDNCHPAGEVQRVVKEMVDALEIATASILQSARLVP